MINNLNKKKSVLCPIFAFIIPIMIILIVSVISGFYPYGKTSILMADMRYQFVDYFAYMKNIFFSNDTYYYSFSKTFGGDMAGLAAYYCNNPFLVFLLFVPNDILPAGILIMMSVMLGLIGLTFYILLSEVYKTDYSCLIFSTAYAFIGYLMGYFNCTLYYFNVMMYPLVMLGIYRIVKNKKISYLYIFSLFLTIFSSYYIGYMTCISSVFFFIYMFIIDCDSLIDVKKNLKSVWIYIYSSIIGVSLAAISLLSAVFSLQGEKSSGILLSLSRNFNISEIFSGLYTTGFHGNVSDGLPLIYSGIISVVFVILFYTNKKILLKEKVVSAIIFMLLILSFWIDALNIIWHGFAHPIGFPYRNSFIFSFFLIFFAYKGFYNIKDGITKLQIVAIISLYLLYSIYLLFIHNENVYPKQILVNLIILAAVLILIYIYKNGKLVNYIIPLLLVIEIMDATLNAYVSVNAYFPKKSEDTTITIEAYKDYIDQTQAIVDYIEDEDTSFYRMEKLYRRSNNDAMMFGYNGLSHFSSCETDQAKRFLGSLGFRDNENWAFYGEGSSTFADCFMGVKYMLSQYDETPKPYEMIYNYEDKSVFKNPYALPLVFGAKNEIMNVTLDDNDHFTFQNAIATVTAGEESNIYRPVEAVKVTLNNVSKNGNDYSKIDKSENAYIQYSFTPDSNDFIYMYFNADALQDTKIIINGLEKQPYFTSYGWSIRELGHYVPGDEVNVQIQLCQDQINIENYEFYYENKAAIADWYEKATQTKCELNKITSSYLEGSANVGSNSDMLIFSFPYETEWSIYIDGTKVEQTKVLNGLMAVNISPGNHIITMKYLPKGIKIGAPISIISLLVLLIMFILKRKNIEK